jgi:hypothetical protein
MCSIIGKVGVGCEEFKNVGEVPKQVDNNISISN